MNPTSSCTRRRRDARDEGCNTAPFRHGRLTNLITHLIIRISKGQAVDGKRETSGTTSIQQKALHICQTDTISPASCAGISAAVRGAWLDLMQVDPASLGRIGMRETPTGRAQVYVERHAKAWESTPPSPENTGGSRSPIECSEEDGWQTSVRLF